MAELYSLQGDWPKPLPFRIVMSDGSTRTEPDTFTPEELADAGYVLAPAQPDVPDGKVLDWNEQWIVREPTADELDVARRKRRAELKTDREAAVAAITVTVGDKVFDGDEVSQDRMVRALKSGEVLGQTSCTWILHDNSVVTVTRDELAMALALSMRAQGAVWVIE